MMARVRIRPLDVEIEAAADATLMGSALAMGYYWPTTCGGEGRCTTCACEVVAGAELLHPMGKGERKALVYERGDEVLRTSIRLACQARVRAAEGVIVVHKAGVRAPVA